MSKGVARRAREGLPRAITSRRARLAAWWERESSRRPELAASVARSHTWLRETFNIRSRLAIWCASLMAAILLLLSFVTYTIADSQLEGSVQQSIKHRAEAIAGALMHEQSASRDVLPTPAPTLTPKQGTPAATVTVAPASTPDPASQAKIQQQLSVTVPDVLGQLDLGFEVLDSQGELKYVAATLHSNGLPLDPGIVNEVLHGAPATSYTAATRATATTPSSLLAIYVQPLIMQSPTEVSQAQIVGVVLAAKPLDDVIRALLTLRQVLLLGDIVAIVLASVGGWFIAERGLRPMTTVTRTAHEIAVNTHTAGLDTRVDTRVPYTGPRDEVGELVTTFNDMLAALERVTNAQRRFVQDASHELRAPLTSIKGNLEFLRRAADLPAEERAAVLADAEAEASRLASLVNDLLILARLDAAGSGYGLGATWLDEQLRGRREPVALDEVVMAVFRQGRTQLQMRHKELHLSVSGLQPTTLLADPGQIRQLVFILVDNAIKYTPAGGRVRLSLAQAEAGWAELTVEDTGIGIAEKDRPHIFERFYRADQARARDEGSGLGLAIAAWIVEAHGGTIAVRSAFGEGTTFTVRLKAEAHTEGAIASPATPAPMEPIQEPIPVAAAETRGVRLLAGAMQPLARMAVTTVSQSRRALRSVRAVSASRRGLDGGLDGRGPRSASAKLRSIKAPIARPGREQRQRRPAGK